MSKELLLVFQDCYDCGVYEDWYQKLSTESKKHDIVIEPTPYNTPGAKKLILAADKQGVNQPFLTDTVKFSKSISDFVEDPQPKPKKKVKHGDSAKA